MKGKFVTFEGCEGVGKSTQLRLIQEYFNKNKIDAVFTREPGGVRICETIRGIILNKEFTEMSPICEAMLYAASRAQLVNEVIIPELEKGKIVLCDRYVDSSFAYQGFARNIGIDKIEAINAPVIKNAIPDLTIFLDLAPREAFRRKGGRDTDDRMENEALDFHEKVYQGYKAVAKKYPNRIVCIRPSGTKMETHYAIITALRDKGIID